MALNLMVDTMHSLNRESAKPETISGIAKDALNEQDVFEDSFYAWQMRYFYYTRFGRPVNRIRKIFLTNPKNFLDKSQIMCIGTAHNASTVC